MKNWWNSCNFLYHTNHKVWRKLCYGVGGLLPITKLGICTKWRANWIRLTIMRSHLECGLWVKDLYSYIKSKQEQHILQLMSWLAQSVDLNPIELVWDELDQKVRAKQPTSAAHFWQWLQKSWAELFSVNFQSLVEKMLRICEASSDSS